MRLSDHICDACILENLVSRDKEAVLAELAAATEHAGIDPDAALRVLRERERLGSTAVGSGIAIPHGKLPGLEKIMLVFGRSSKGIDFGAADDVPCRLFFMLLAPEGAAGQQLALLGSIARLVRDESFRSSLLQAHGLEELRALFSVV